MSIAKIAGIETEFGIVLRGVDERDPVAESRRLLMAYLRAGMPVAPCQSSFESASRLWRYPAVAPYMDPARGEAAPSRPLSPPEASGLVAATPPRFTWFSYMLPNGARLYIDHAHPEYATPECLQPRDLLAADKAGEAIVDRCRALACARLPRGQTLQIYKNNADAHGASYGCHENYLLQAQFFERLLYDDPQHVLRLFVPFLITRTLLCGAGKVGAAPGRQPAGFQLAQRADFFETLIGIQTTERRPLFNTRDEPHADPTRYRRLHVIIGDANMAEYSGLLKIGTTQLVLRMLEDAFVSDDLSLVDPLAAMRTVSRDLTLRAPLEMRHMPPMTALDVQQRFLAAALTYIAECGATDQEREVVQIWHDTLDDLRHNAARLRRRLDWAIKRHLLDALLERMRTTWEEVEAWQPVIDQTRDIEPERFADDPTAALALLPPEVAYDISQHMRSHGLEWTGYGAQCDAYYGLRRLDLDYHLVHRGSDSGQMGLYYRLRQHGAIDCLLTDDAIAEREVEPPPDTRAWLRGQWVRRYAADTANADWSRIVFYHGGAPYVLPLTDPFDNTRHDWQESWDSSDLILNPQRSMRSSHQKQRRSNRGAAPTRSAVPAASTTRDPSAAPPAD